MSDVRVQLLEPMRLMAAVLAASTWPDREQAQTAHAVHAQARQTRHFLTAGRLHPVVRRVDALLAQDVKIDVLFSRALGAADWQRRLEAFDRETELSQRFWPAHEETWQTAVSELDALVPGQELAQFLTRCATDPLESRIVIMPNLLYPALRPTLAGAADEVALLLPPPRAVGESPPWPFVEDPGWVNAHVCQTLIAHVARTKLATLSDENQALAIHAATALFLESSLGRPERLAYVMAGKKQQMLERLPEVFDQLRIGAASPGASLMANLEF